MRFLLKLDAKAIKYVSGFFESGKIFQGRAMESLERKHKGIGIDLDDVDIDME